MMLSTISIYNSDVMIVIMTYTIYYNIIMYNYILFINILYMIIAQLL